MKRYNMSKDIAVKVINVRNPFNDDLSKEFIYDGIDARVTDIHLELHK